MPDARRRRLAGVGIGVLLLAAFLPASVVASPVGPPSQLAFTVQPASTAAGATIAPDVTVWVEDASGNLVTTDTSLVTVAIDTNPSTGTLSGTTSAAASGGIATFSNLSIDNAGTGYTLKATDGTLTSVTSNPFNVLGATQLAFGVQPSVTGAGQTITPAVTVRIEDANGDVVPASTASVSLAILSNPSLGSLTGGGAVAAADGVATFGSLSIDNPGTGYTFVATSNGLSGATSNAFNIVGPPAQLAFGVQPSTTAAGGTIGPAVTIKVEDANGNVVPGDTSSIALAIGNDPSSGVLSGTTPVTAVNGVATFGNLSIDNAGNGYTLHATDASNGTVTAATSNAFNVTGTPTQLAFGVQPATTAAGAAITPAVTVKVEDANGNIVTSDSSLVTLAIGNNPAVGTLSGTVSVHAVNGVATFGNLSINNAGSGYTLRATDGTLAAATSNGFTITASNRLVFITQPGGGAAGTAWSQQPVVAVENSLGQVVTTDNSTIVYLSIATNPAGGVLSCTSGTGVPVVNGYATFSGCSISLGSTSYYTLSATSSPAWTAATSSAFYVSGSSEQLVFITQPGGGAAGTAWSQQPVVAVENSLGQVVTTDNSTIVYLSIATNPAGGVLSCTSGTGVPVVNGYATFSGCSISLGSTSYYTLSATSSPAWTAATSSAFYVSGSSEQLVFITQPGGGAAGTAWSQQPVVAVENSLGQVVTTDNSTIVYLSIATNPAGGVLSCTSGTGVPVVNGYATFSGCSISLGSTSYYTLSATSSPAWTAATSSAFYVSGSSEQPITFTTGSAIGNVRTGSFTKATKIQTAGGYITWQFDGGLAAAGQKIQLWVYKKYSPYGAWTKAILLTTRVADSNGIAYGNIVSNGVLWLSVRPVLPATSTSAAIWGPTSIGRWIR